MNAELAHLSDVLFTTAIATYSLAMVGYCAEYAFGRKGRIAETATVRPSARPAAPAVVRVPALVGAGSNASSARSTVVGPPAVPLDPPSAEHGRRPRADLAGRLAVLVTALGALIHLTSIVLRGTAVDRVPWGNMYEFSAVAGLIAVVAWLVVLYRLPMLRYLGLFVLLPVIVLMFLAGNVLYAKAQPLVPALQSYWLAIHVSAAASGEGMLMTSAVLAILYLVRTRYDVALAAGKAVRANGLGARLPAAAVLDKASYRIVAFAFPIYTFGVICGAIWAEAAWGRYWGWDPKETWAFIAWVVYAAYLHARATAGWKGRNAAFINILGFAAMTFNFFVVNIFVTGLHSYAGLN